MIDRPDLLVIGRLLEALAPGPLSKTPWEQQAGLSSPAFLRYLDLVIRWGLVRTTSSGEAAYALTSRGREAHRFLSERLARILGPMNGNSRRR